MIADYKKLKAGDMRKHRDEQRRKLPHTDYTVKFQTNHPAEFAFNAVYLVGHIILQSDLMIFEFRRPLL